MNGNSQGMPLRDSVGFDLLAAIDEAADFLRDMLAAGDNKIQENDQRQQNHVVLVHCVQGIS